MESNIPIEDLIRVSWRKGVLNYKLKPWQHKLYNSVWDCINKGQSTYLVNCSRRYGKTFVLILIAIEYAIRFPKSQIKYAIPVGQEYIDMVLPSIEHIIDDFPTSKRKMPKGGFAEQQYGQPNHNAQGKRIKFENGSVIKFAGVNDDDATGLRGNTSNLNIVDEAGFMNNLDKVYRTILSPQTLTTGGSTIFVSTPPDTPDHDFSVFYRQHKENGRLSEFDVYTWADEKQLARAIEDSGGAETTTFKREYLVQFVTETDMQIVSEWDDKFIIPDDISPSFLYPYEHKYVAMDMGTVDLTAVLFASYDFQNTCLVIEKDLTMAGTMMTTQSIASRIKEEQALLWGDIKPFKYIADNNNPQMTQDMAITYGLPFVRTDKEDLEAMVNQLKVFIQQGKLKVKANCKHLIGCLKFGVWARNKRGKMFAHSKQYGHYDGLAALIYLVRKLDRVTNPYPADLSISHRTHSMPVKTEVKMTEQVRSLNNIFKPKRRWNY